MWREKLFKLFHLVSDNTPSVPQKVFLKDEELSGLQLQLKKDCKTLGLIGTVNSIKLQILKFYQQLNILQKSKDKQEEIQIIDLSLSLQERAAIFLLYIHDLSDESNYNYCLILFVAPDDFYYQKPIQQNLMHLLIRFMVDLCPTNLILYDQKIQKQFQQFDSPYAGSVNEFISLKMKDRSHANIIIEKDIPCNFTKILQYDPEYPEKIFMDFPIQTKYILYNNLNISQQNKKNKINQQLFKVQIYLFETIYKRQQKNVAQIQLEANKQSISLSKDLITSVLNYHNIFCNQLRKVNKSYFSKFSRQTSLFSWFQKVPNEKFQKRIYHNLIVKQIQLKESNNFEFKKEKKIQQNLLQTFIEELSITNKYQIETYKTNWSKSIIQMWQYIKKIVEETINMLFNLTNNYFNSLGENNKKKIDLTLFHIESIFTKQGSLENISTVDYSVISFNFKIFCQKLQNESLSLSSIKNINIYDIKGQKKVFLFWLQLSVEKNNQFSAILFKLCGYQMIIIKKIKKENLKFIFNKNKQKGYLIDPKQSKIISFYLDSFKIIKEEKFFIFRKSPLKQKIISFGITLNPEILFYLTEEANCIFSYNLQSGQQLQICKQINSKKYLTTDQNLYKYIKTFNQDIYLILGNKNIIDIISYDLNGGFDIKQRILLDSINFIGATIFADKWNQYLIIHNYTNSKACAFLNMSCQNILEQDTKKKSIKLGNPILDIFHQSRQRFGNYIFYNNSIKQIKMFHLTDMDTNKLNNYLNELQNIDCCHQIVKKQQNFSLIDKITNPLPFYLFIKIIETRIPIQICTIHDGNILPLVKGKRENTHFYGELSVSQRSKILNFGIVQRTLLGELSKRTIVISIIGGQSTGKSYLMNRVFQTRFAVASSRTTDGIWLAVIKKRHFNYLLLDCEGLFSTDRSALEQEKLVKILASLSDYTILNQNMSMNNRSLTQLMDQISASAGKLITNQSKKLYQGQLYAIIRDTKSRESLQIKEQFIRNFQNNENRRGNQFIRKFFGGSVQLFPVNHYGDRQFQNDILTIRKRIQEQGLKRPLRSARQILQSLKIIMIQLTCDDSKQFQQNVEDYQIQMGKEKVFNIWINGSDKNQKIEGIIYGKQISIFENEVIINMKISSMKDLIIFDNIFKSKVIGQTESDLKSTDFNSVYQQFNDFIVKFFQHRKNLVEEEILKISVNELKQIKQQKKKQIVSEMETMIYNRTNLYKLCLGDCYKCKLVCINTFGHREDISSQRQIQNTKKREIQREMKQYSLSQKQKQLIQSNLDTLEDKLDISISQLRNNQKKINQHTFILQTIKQNESAIKQATNEINKIKADNEKCLKDTELILQQFNKFQKQIIIISEKSQSRILSQLIQRIKQFSSNKLNIELNNKQQLSIIKQMINVNMGKIQKQMNKTSKKNQIQILKLQKDINQTSQHIQTIKPKIQNYNNQINEKNKLITTEIAKQNIIYTKIKQQADKKNQTLKEKQTVEKQIAQIECQQNDNNMKFQKMNIQKRNIEKEIIQLLNQIKLIKISLNQQKYEIDHKYIIKQYFKKLIEIEKQISKNQISLSHEKYQHLKNRIYQIIKNKEEISIQIVKKDIEQKLKLISAKLKKNQKQSFKNQNLQNKKMEYQNILNQLQESGILSKNIIQKTLKEKKTYIIQTIFNYFGQKGLLIKIFSQFSSQINTYILKNSQIQQSSIFLKQLFICSKKNQISQKDICDKLIQMPIKQLHIKKKSKIEQLKIKIQNKQNQNQSEIEGLDNQISQLKKQIQQLNIIAQFIKFKATTIGSKKIKKFIQLIVNNFLLNKQGYILRDSQMDLKQVNLNQKDKILSKAQLLKKKIMQKDQQLDECQDFLKYEQIETQLNQLNTQYKLNSSLLSYIQYAISKLVKYIEQFWKEFTSLHGINYLGENHITINIQLLKLDWKNNISEQSNDNTDEIFIKFNDFLTQIQDKQTSSQNYVYPLCLDSYKRNKRQMANCLNILIENINKLPFGLKDSYYFKLMIEQSVNLSDFLLNAQSYIIQTLLLEISLNKSSKINQMQIKNNEIKLKQQSLLIQKNYQLKIDSLKNKKQIKKEKMKDLQIQINNILQIQNQSKKQKDKIVRKHNQLLQQKDQLIKVKNDLQNKIRDLQVKLQNKQKQLNSVVLLQKTLSQIKFKKYIQLIQKWEQKQLNNFDQLINQQLRENFCINISVNNQELRRYKQSLQAQIGKAQISVIRNSIVEIQVKLNELKHIKKKIAKLDYLESSRKTVNKNLQNFDNILKQSCSCKTNHECQFVCQSNCIDKRCAKPAGHLGHHLCNQKNHLCSQNCKTDLKCNKKCLQIFEHDQNIIHNCHEDHKCTLKCQYCDKNCSNNKFDEHEEHCCDTKGCTKYCLLCQKSCNSVNHNHDKNTITVEITKENQYIKRQLHLCGNQHHCLFKCSLPGICKYTYQENQFDWKHKWYEAKYRYIKQIQERYDCDITIPAGQLKHQGQCQCRKKHTCDIKCPDCKSGCALLFNHTGKHQTYHRNQQSLIYAAENKSQTICIKSKIQSETIKQFVFQVGDTSTPTTCYQSCRRKGRGHYHLLQCRGGDKCGQRKYDNIEEGAIKLAIHSDKKYYPYIQKKYDLYLCSAYWENCNFAMPNFQQKKEYDSCNFYCPLNHDRRQEKPMYCNKLAWHSRSQNRKYHQFDCDSHHQSSKCQKIQICFLMDVTGSMERFINQCKKTIKAIIKRACEIDERINIQFSIVGYRDHFMYTSNITIKLKQLTYERQKQLRKLPQSPYMKQTITKIEFIKKLLDLQRKYQINKNISEELLTDFSQQQLCILKYHYPYALDTKSDERFLPDQILSLSLVFTLDQLDPKKTLKDYLLEDFEYYRQKFDADEKQEKQEQTKFKLIEMKDFTNNTNIQQFLNKLEATGGGDPPEAVLDGMNAILNLGWSESLTTIKYIFHIFDSPPHGKQFGQGYGDRFPDGCPCDNRLDTIIKKIIKLNANYIIYPLNPKVNKAMKLFEDYGLKFKKQKIDKGCPTDFTLHAVETVCSSLQQTDFMVRNA